MDREEKLKWIMYNLFEHEDKFDNKEFLIDYLGNNFKVVPRKLYKYRTCNRRNINSLKENKVFFSPFKNVDDDLDFTVNIAPFKSQDLTTMMDNLLMLDFEPFFQFIVDNKVAFIQTPFYEQLIDTSELMLHIICYSKKYNLSFEENIKTAYETIKPGLYQYYSDSTNVDTFNEYFEKGMLESNIRDERIVYCMAERYDVGPMWSLYAGENSGFVIEYSFEEFERYDVEVLKLISLIMPSIYDNKSEYDSAYIANLMAESVVMGDTELEIDWEERVKIYKELLTKNPDWKYQDEWRIVLNEESGRLVDFPFVSSIILGEKISEYNKRRLLNYASKRNVKVLQQERTNMGSAYTYIELSVDEYLGQKRK